MVPSGLRMLIIGSLWRMAAGVVVVIVSGRDLHGAGAERWIDKEAIGDDGDLAAR